MSNVLEEKIGNFTLKVSYDEYPWNPREDDNLTKMICFHKRHNLGDKHDLKSDDFNGWDEMEKFIIKNEKPLIIKPLYLYEHSGITISTSPFSCRWDSCGQIGFVFIRKEDVRNEFSIKRCGQPIKERCNVLLEGEVDTYDKYLRGECYLYRVENEKGEVVESCMGFFDEDECTEEGKSIIEYLNKEKEKESV